MQIIIIEHTKTGHNRIEILTSRTDVNAAQVVEKWQKNSLHYRVHKTLPELTWKVSEVDNFISAMSEASHMANKPQGGAV